MSATDRSQSVWTCGPEESAAEAARRMRDNSVGCLIVLKDGRPVGIVTDRDLVLRTLAHGQDPEKTQVAKCLSAPLVTATPNATALEASEMMRSAGVRRLPLVDESGALCGILTADALIQVLSRELESLSKAAQKRLGAEDDVAAAHQSTFGME